MRYFAMLALAVLLPAEVIDRVAVAVEKRVIAESEILRQIRITAFLNGEEPDLSPSAKRAMADRLVEQILIRRELENSRMSGAGTDAGVTYLEFKKKYKSEQAYREALAKYGLSDEDIKGALDWQATLLDFIELRFRPGVQVTESDVREYYDQQVALNPGKLPPYEEARSDIEKILTSRLVDNALDRWLGQARLQSRIRYRQEVFQ